MNKLTEQFSEFASTRVFVARGHTDVDSSPYREEEVLMTSAVSARKLEFYSGRHQARNALQQAGYPPRPILRGKKGDPLWPIGVHGSITHDQGQVIAAVVHEGEIKGIGIDLIVDPTSVDVSLEALIASNAEVKLLLSVCRIIPPLALAFSLKEAIVKAVSPSINEYINLRDIQLDVKGEQLTATLPVVESPVRCKSFMLNRSLITFAIWR